MSSPACRKFFELPELFQQLCSFLRPHDLAKLLRISRDLYYVTGPHFWPHIDLEDDRKVDRLITTPEALEAFAKNVPFMHTLTAGFIFVSYYFEGMMRYLDEQELLPKRTCSLTSNIDMQRPLWLPQVIVRTPSARPLPPMIRLSQLDICFQRHYRGVQFDNVMRLNKPVRLFRPLVWLMNLNAAGLTHVCFRYMDLPDPLELRCLARSLSDLRNLTHLTIDMLSTGLTSWLSAPFIFVLFFALPRSVVSVKLEAMVHASSDDEAEERRLRVVPDTREEGDEDEEEIEPSPDWVEGDLVAREESLERLKELVLPSYKMGYTADQIRRMLRHCPVLERWDIPCLRDDRAAEALTEKITSRTIAMILSRCHGLEKFWATGTYGQPIYLNLNDAIEQEWVCKEIKDLRITVDLSALSKQEQGRSAGGERRKVEAGESLDFLATKEYWTSLGIFYTQLGKLTKLEALELIAADVERGWNWSSTYMSEALPGLLSLEEEDKETKKRGFLSLLGGLKKLRVVHGSFWSGSRAASKTFGQRETEWVVKNWPALEQVELLPQKYMRYAAFDMPKHLEWLRKEKPELKLCR
ncbi:hypothetical protein BGZ91_009605 [Linnemannia elongata]|nr:hypothetical protein BGZ91_009605 [Linnemannia elongata]